MTFSQGKKLSFSVASFFSIVVLTMLLLKIPMVANFFSPEYVYSKEGIAVWGLMWLIIFLECSIVPGPYLPFLIFFAATPLADDVWFFIGIVTTATCLGRAAAYWVGKAVGGSMLRWAATDKDGRDDFDKWTAIFRRPEGKAIYAMTVYAPLFPDFILALIAGSVGINYTFYLIVNFTNSIMLNTVVTMFIASTSAGKVMFYLYIVIVVASLIAGIVCTILDKKKQKNQ